MNEEVKKDKIMYECMVSLKSAKYDTLLSLTEKHLFFKKKKGLFQKKYKVIKDILITDIKVIKNKVKIEQDNNKIIVHTKDTEIYFTCESAAEAKKLVTEISNAALGGSSFKRFKDKSTKVISDVSKAIEAVGSIAEAASEFYEKK